MSWEYITLGDIASFSNGINFDKSAYSLGIKLISVSDFGNRFSPDFTNLQEVKKETVRENDYLKEGDIVFVRSNGNKELVGRCMLIQHLSQPVTFSGFVIRGRIQNTEKYDPVFFTYHFKNIAFRRAMSGTAVGANIQNLSQSRLSAYVAKIPNIDTQRRIAHILSAYDDLIENNQRQIRLLEEAAQRLYKEWFVDFRFPGYENTPIVDGVPEGWNSTTMDETCQAIGGGTPSTSKKEYYEGGNIRWVTPTDLTKTGSWILLDTEKKITNEGLDNSSAKMLPPDTILMTSRASIGYIALCENEVCTNQGFISCVPYYEKLRYYLMFNLLNRVDEIKAKATGSTFLEISKRTFREMAIIVPSEQVLMQFDSFILPVIQKMRTLRKGTESLTKARDRLLPKLMSGEMEV